MSARVIGPVVIGPGRSALFIELTGRLDSKFVEQVRLEIGKVARSGGLKVTMFAVKRAKSPKGGTKRRKKKK